MKIALGIPHTPWVDERLTSLNRMLGQLECAAEQVRREGDLRVRVFDHREPNRDWARRMWTWALETEADFFLTLQDDVEVSPAFWSVLRAMLAVLPKGAALGLSAVHPVGQELARQGERWYRTRSWLVGWAYGLWREDLANLIEYEQTAPLSVTEDSCVNRWIRETKRDTWHPLPSIVDHDTTIPSSYANDGHAHRRLFVRWEGFSVDAMSTPEFWRPQDGAAPPLLPDPVPRLCWFCLEAPPVASGRKTGACVCRGCLAGMAHAVIGGAA